MDGLETRNRKCLLSKGLYTLLFLKNKNKITHLESSHDLVESAQSADNGYADEA